MGIRLYCDTCGSKSLYAFDRRLGEYRWIRTCVCDRLDVVIPGRRVMSRHQREIIAKAMEIMDTALESARRKS